MEDISSPPVRGLFKKYTDFTTSVSIYPDAGKGTLQALCYTTLGLTGEAGEAANRCSKLMRDGDAEWLRATITEELGDIIFYWFRMCVELGVNPEEVIEANIKKLEDRKKRGVLKGSGDKR